MICLHFHGKETISTQVNAEIFIGSKYCAIPHKDDNHSLEHGIQSHKVITVRPPQCCPVLHPRLRL